MKRTIFMNDIKIETTPMIARGCKELGIELDCINPTNKHPDLCPHVNYNSFEAAPDSYWSEDPEAQKNTTTFLHGYAALIAPRAEKGVNNEFFVNNGNLTCDCLIGTQVVDSPETATPSQIYRIASEPDHAREIVYKWAEGSHISPKDKVAQDIRRKALALKSIIEETPKHWGDFLSHVTFPLQAFGESGHLADAGEYATARFSDARRRAKFISIMTPLSHSVQFETYTSLYFYAMFLACKMVPDGVPVHAIWDEFTSAKFPDFHKEMLTMRGLSMSAELYVQDRTALAEQMGEKPAKAIFNQSDVKQISAIDNYADDAREFSGMLGSINRKEFDARVEGGFFDTIGFGLRDTDEPLASEQRLMAAPRDEQFIKIRGMYPIRAKKLPYWCIKGLNEFYDDNPLEGPAPDVKPVAELDVSRDGVKVVWPKVSSRFNNEPKDLIKRERLLNFRSFIWAYIWAALLILIFSGASWYPPALRYAYAYSGPSSSPVYTRCDYVDLIGQRFTTHGGECPFILWD